MLGFASSNQPTGLRNLCAHHSKLWNRNFTLQTLIANNYHNQLEKNANFSAQAAILKILLDLISPTSDWAYHLQKLITKNPKIDIARMEFKKDWVIDPFWRLLC